MRFAVVDVETTGLNPQVDRVIDLCVVMLDEFGNLEGELATLVRVWPPPPGAPGDVYESAPEFGEVAGHVASVLEGRVLVGHNVTFDLRMLQSEFTRCGLDLHAASTLDTLIGDRLINPNESGRSLRLLASRMGLNDYVWHTAQGDARATAEIFRMQLMHPAMTSIASAAEPVTIHGNWRSSKPILAPRDPKTFPPSTRVLKTEQEVLAEEVARAERLRPLERDVQYGPSRAFESSADEMMELVERMREMTEKLGSLPEVQERRRAEDQQLREIGAMGRDEAYELWEQGEFRTKASMDELAAVIETFEVLDDIDELLPALFKMVRMSSQFRDDARFRAFTGRFVDNVERGDEDDTYVTDQAIEFLEWLIRRPEDLLKNLSRLGPVVLRDEDEGVDNLFGAVVQASSVAATAGDLNCALELLDVAETFAEQAESVEELQLARFDAHRGAKSPDAIAFGLKLWSEELRDEDLARWLIDSLVGQGDIDGAMRLGTEALQKHPDSRRLRAAVGRIHRELNNLRD